MVIKKIGDHLNKMVYIDSRHIMFFIGVVLLFVGLVAFVGYSVTGKVIGVSHTASEVKLDSEEFPSSDTVREALVELKTSGGGGYGEDIPQCITYCLTPDGSYVSLDNGADSVTCANLGFVATLAYPGSSFCLSEGVLYTKSYTTGIYVSNVDSAVESEFAKESQSADKAGFSDFAVRSGVCTLVGFHRTELDGRDIQYTGQTGCLNDETKYVIELDYDASSTIHLYRYESDDESKLLEQVRLVYCCPEIDVVDFYNIDAVIYQGIGEEKGISFVYTENIDPATCSVSTIGGDVGDIHPVEVFYSDIDCKSMGIIPKTYYTDSYGISHSYHYGSCTIIGGTFPILSNNEKYYLACRENWDTAYKDWEIIDNFPTTQYA